MAVENLTAESRKVLRRVSLRVKTLRYIAINFAKHCGKKPKRRVTQSTKQSLAKVKKHGVSWRLTSRNMAGENLTAESRKSTTQSLAKVKNIALNCGKKTPNKLLK